MNGSLLLMLLVSVALLAFTAGMVHEGARRGGSVDLRACLVAGRHVPERDGHLSRCQRCRLDLGVEIDEPSETVLVPVLRVPIREDKPRQELSS